MVLYYERAAKCECVQLYNQKVNIMSHDNLQCMTTCCITRKKCISGSFKTTLFCIFLFKHFIGNAQKYYKHEKSILTRNIILKQQQQQQRRLRRAVITKGFAEVSQTGHHSRPQCLRAGHAQKSSGIKNDGTQGSLRGAVRQVKDGKLKVP